MTIPLMLAAALALAAPKDYSDAKPKDFGLAWFEAKKDAGVFVAALSVRAWVRAQVPNIGGIGHQVHHKFVVCGFNGDDPTVYCGSSNLALVGEQVNGDNLLCIKDAGIAAVFAIEALCLVDHFNFLDSAAKGPKAKGSSKPIANKQPAAVSAGWFLGTDDSWAHKFFDQQDLHCRDRMLFVRTAT